MNTFTKGVLAGVGIGVSVGLLVAPLSGKEARRLFTERAITLRTSFPEDAHLNQYASQVASKVKETGAALGSRAMQTGQEIASRAKETGQDMASRVLQTAGFTGPGANGANRRAMPEE